MERAFRRSAGSQVFIEKTMQKESGDTDLYSGTQEFFQEREAFVSMILSWSNTKQRKKVG